ncbi:uncharacterized protein TNCV_2270531 [Trichonephila clavipes]|nr:uncharacterized protein TNCV_2270531 [Trichonephila clavipes]
MNARIWGVMVGIKKPASMQISLFSRSCCKEYRNLLLMHDGAKAHFSLAVRNHLHTSYAGRWIGRSRPFAWPACSPDFNLLDFFYWATCNRLCMTQIVTVQDLTARIIITSADIAITPDLFKCVRQCFVHQCRLCYDLRSHSFEQFL